ncbi:MAG: hypothetical protein QG670_1313 [Thermoproteota archaeon]|nr:hypothetical protein [Thermoproteota archaeon]
MTRERTISCPDCGESNKVRAPDDVHDTVSLDEKLAKAKGEGTIIKKIYECEDCIYTISLYWYKPKI